MPHTPAEKNATVRKTTWGCIVVFVSVLGLTQFVSAQTYTFSTIYNFPPATATSVKNPAGGIIDASGNLYGVSGGGKYGFGTVFELTPKGVLSVLHNFSGVNGDGNLPTALLRNSIGTIYGETFYGGTYDWGTIYKLAPGGGRETILYNFPNENLFGGLRLGSTGDLYGSYADGDSNSAYGSVFQLSHSGTFSNVYSFCSLSNCADGYSPGAVIMKGGNLYGATSYGGDNVVFGQGVVFELTPEGQETVLHTFMGGPDDGANPIPKLTQDTVGNLYGTTQNGGKQGVGTIFKIDTSGVESILYHFCSLANCSDGSYPQAPVVVDAAGNLYGVTSEGGSSMYANGTAYRLSPEGVFTVLHDAGSGNAGLGGGLVMDRSGNLYGMTYLGGTHHTGSVYKLTRHN